MGEDLEQPKPLEIDEESEEAEKSKNLLKDLKKIMVPTKNRKGRYREELQIPDYRYFDPNRFEVGASRLIYVVERYNPAKTSSDIYSKEVDEEIKFVYDYKLLFSAHAERPEKYYRKGRFLFKPVRRLGQGNYFGEVGLILTKPRTETVIAADEVHMATITKKQIIEMFPEILENINKRLTYIVPYFQIINHVYLVKLVALMNEEVHNYNQYVYKEGDTPNGMYILVSGEIHIIKEIEEKKYLIKTDTRSIASGVKRKYLVKILIFLVTGRLLP